MISLEDAQSAARARRDLAVYKQGFVWKDVKSRRPLRAIQSTGNALSGFGDALSGCNAALSGLVQSLNRAHVKFAREKDEFDAALARLSAVTGRDMEQEFRAYAQSVPVDWRIAIGYARTNLMAGMTIDGKRGVSS